MRPSTVTRQSCASSTHAYTLWYVSIVDAESRANIKAAQLALHPAHLISIRQLGRLKRAVGERREAHRQVGAQPLQLPRTAVVVVVVVDIISLVAELRAQGAE